MSIERELIYAVMHHPMHAPGIGNIKETLTDSPSAMFQSTKMTLEAEGNLVRLEFKDKGGKTIVALVPASNFKILVLK